MFEVPVHELVRELVLWHQPENIKVQTWVTVIKWKQWPTVILLTIFISTIMSSNFCLISVSTETLYRTKRKNEYRTWSSSHETFDEQLASPSWRWQKVYTRWCGEKLHEQATVYLLLTLIPSTALDHKYDVSQLNLLQVYLHLIIMIHVAVISIPWLNGPSVFQTLELRMLQSSQNLQCKHPLVVILKD